EAPGLSLRHPGLRRHRLEGIVGSNGLVIANKILRVGAVIIQFLLWASEERARVIIILAIIIIVGTKKMVKPGLHRLRMCMLRNLQQIACSNRNDEHRDQEGADNSIASSYS